MITILLSHERSGSHFLGDFISRLDGVCMIDEVCNPNAVDPKAFPESFFAFKDDWCKRHEDYIRTPTPQAVEEFFVSYFEYLRTMEKYESVGRIVVDVKYGHVHNFEIPWWPILRRPAFFTFCLAHDISVIHLFRHNVVEAAASAAIAEQRKIWHSTELVGTTTESRPMELAAESIANDAWLLREQIRWFKRWVKGLRKLELTYEEISAELATNAKLQRTVAKFVDGKIVEPFESRYRKVTPPLNEIVANYDEVINACRERGLDFGG
ncbi:MAG: hypothetical protein H6923_10745 [Alphaproteobacteria bacterium]|nr:hypothetical protein [Alphaproteobacteria bacterium]